MHFTRQTVINQAIDLVTNQPPNFDRTEATNTAEQFLPSIHDALLSSHSWNFAKYTCFPPTAKGYDFIDLPYAYRLPTDCIRIIKVRPICSPRPLRYQILGQYIHTTTNVAVIEFISRIPIEECPAYYLSALVALLAAELAIPLTESTSLWDHLREMADAERHTAQLEDNNHQNEEINQ